MSAGVELGSERLNKEVAAWKGCTFGEIVMVGAGCFVVFGVISCLGTLIAFDSITYGLIVAIVLTTIVASSLLKRLGKLKEGKPPGYVSQYIRRRAKRFGVPSPFLERSGKWSVARKD